MNLRSKGAGNFAPRFGLAWNVRGTGKYVIRAGFGMYYNNIQTQLVPVRMTLRLRPSHDLLFILVNQQVWVGNKPM